MARYELRLSKEDFEDDQSPEVLVEFYEYKDVQQAPAQDRVDQENRRKTDRAELKYVAFVSSSSKDGNFDTVSGNTNVDDQAGHDSRDDQILIDLAQAFARIHMG
ncbi:hypothetical protein [Pseudomonas cichorii]|uniref:hypothetical protein n=1 Tax=Pseudomonas cichorii TaxID=36746 RepID=UPI000EFE5091|nr:hypothetical protein [Pseudomonas cichorii]